VHKPYALTPQDRVPPFPTAMARKILEQELGRPVEQVYDDFAEVITYRALRVVVGRRV